MKKSKGNKKRKAKKKWSKQVGNFVFKRPVFFSEGNGVRIDTYFKEELIGYLMVPTSYYAKDEYTLSIYDVTSSNTVGQAQCKGRIHSLPKSILKVKLMNSSSVLSPNRVVIIEKYKAPEIKLSTPTRIMILPRR